MGGTTIMDSSEDNPIDLAVQLGWWAEHYTAETALPIAALTILLHQLSLPHGLTHLRRDRIEQSNGCPGYDPVSANSSA